jgi:hypothetical protein
MLADAMQCTSFNGRTRCIDVGMEVVHTSQRRPDSDVQERSKPESKMEHVETNRHVPERLLT